jgi:hypothetical protein
MRYSKLGYYGLPAVAFGVMAAGIFLLRIVLPVGPSWTKAILICLVCAAALGLAVSSYRYGDEIMLGTRKTAWLWGSKIGVLLGLPVVVGYCWNLFPLPIANDPRPAFALGYTFLALMQGVGAFLFRAITRLRNRAE